MKISRTTTKRRRNGERKNNLLLHSSTRSSSQPGSIYEWILRVYQCLKHYNEYHHHHHHRVQVRRKEETIFIHSRKKKEGIKAFNNGARNVISWLIRWQAHENLSPSIHAFGCRHPFSSWAFIVLFGCYCCTLRRNRDLNFLLHHPWWAVRMATGDKRWEKPDKGEKQNHRRTLTSVALVIIISSLLASYRSRFHFSRFSALSDKTLAVAVLSATMLSATNTEIQFRDSSEFQLIFGETSFRTIHQLN